jgi:uncharacterized protein YjbI with pentapeptide repeats
VIQLPHHRWRPSRRHLLWGSVALATLTLVIVGICGYLFGWKWTGLPKRTLWDWLTLLIVPGVLAIGGYLFTRSENQRRDRIAEDQRSLDRELADERRQDDMLQAYLDGMSQLLTDEMRPLHRSQVGDSLSTVARARTLTALTRLDSERKQSVLQFLIESGLINKDRLVVDLSGADLSEVDLQSGVKLARAGLRETNLSRSILSMADPTKADLGGADLSKANLSGAFLSEANLEGANMSEADLNGATLWGANATSANMSKTNLNGATLVEATLWGTNLSGATVTRANLSGANLDMANLSEANLTGTFLSNWGDLSGANLTRANLSGANLSGTDLNEAILEDASLAGAKGWTEEQLSKAASLDDATMPDGQRLKGLFNTKGPPFNEWLKSKDRGEGE